AGRTKTRRKINESANFFGMGGLDRFDDYGERRLRQMLGHRLGETFGSSPRMEQPRRQIGMTRQREAQPIFPSYLPAYGPPCLRQFTRFQIMSQRVHFDV